MRSELQSVVAGVRDFVAAAALCLFVVPATAATSTLSVAFDVDSNPSTGCTIAGAAGSITGMEQVATTVVTTTPTGATVTRLERQLCTSGVLGSPTPYDPGGWAVGLGNGAEATAAVETSVPLGLFPPVASMRAVVYASDGAGGSDVTSPFAITLQSVDLQGTSIPVPLSPWLLPPLALLVLGATAWLRRRHPGQVQLFVTIAAVAVSGLVWAATAVRDGSVGDWAGIAAAIVDARGDAPVNADIAGVYVQQDSVNLYLRIDADIRRDASDNQAPVVDAGGNRTVSLPASASLPGTATDDGLPNPPGALTVAWSTASGPGTVAFGNAASASTTASFSVAGTYVLRLTASDGALTTTSDATVTVLASGTSNLAPMVIAGTDQVIALPSGATLYGTADDDGLPTPSRLTVAWSQVSGPGTVAFATPGATATNATFPQPGNYVLRLTAHDGALTSTSDLTVRVTTPIVVNEPPRVSAGPDQTVLISAGAALGGSGSDDGNPSPAQLTHAWSKVSGPGTVTFATPSSATTTVTFGSVGTYVLRLAANDGALTASSDVKVTVYAQTALPPSSPAIAVADTYEARVNQTLNVTAPGVLANDENPSNRPITSVRVSNPDKGTLTAFNADGSFTFVAPSSAAPPAFGMGEQWRNDVAGQMIYSFLLVGDVNGDGFPDALLNNQGNTRAADGRTGATLWNLDTTGWTDCYYFTNAVAHVLADVDDDGKVEYVGALAGCERDSRVGAPGYAPFDRIFAVDASTGRIKWVSPRVSALLADVRGPGDPPSPEERWKHVYDATYFAAMHVTRFSPGAPPTLLFRANVNRQEGFYTPTTGPNRSTGCRAMTGLDEDDGTSCRLTILMSGIDGTVQQMLKAPNPSGFGYDAAGRDPSRERAPFTVDLDGDGEVEIVSGSDVWKKVNGTWTLLWQSHWEPIQALASDLDGDGKAEIVHFHAFDKTGGPSDPNDSLYRFHGLIVRDGVTGAEKRRIRLPFYWTAWLTIADADGDKAPDFVINTQGMVMVIGTDGRIRWTYDVPNRGANSNAGFRSGAANAQVYDLDGDGIPEVVTNSNTEVAVLNGRTGALKASVPMAGFIAGAGHQQSIQIVDADNDGHADIVAQNFTDQGATRYVMIRGAPNNWLPGPKIHHQVNFMSGDVADNGRVLFNTAVPTSFRNPAQRGTVGDPRAATGTSFEYAIDEGSSNSAPARVFIDIKPSNLPPVITSTPPTSLHQRFNPNPPGGLFTNFYRVTAFDPDAGDTLTYSLHSAPSHVTMDATGLIRFEPTCGSFGNPCPWGWTYVTARVTDSHGAHADQSFMVNLTTSAASVPNVVGQLLAAAESSIGNAGLVPAVLDQVANAAPVGTVLSQDPLAGAANVGAGATVNLVVSKGPQPVAVPFVVGLPLAVANQRLATLGLTSAVTSTPSATVPVGQVIDQTPAAGVMLIPIPANAIALTVSAGAPLAGAIASIVVEPAFAARLTTDRANFRATAIFADRTSADITLAATWTSSLPNVATVDASGSALARQNGTATITASLNGKSGTAHMEVAAPVAGDGTPPVATITSPADAARVIGPIDVVGSANDANFHRYELAVAADGSADFTVIGEGTTPVNDGVLGTFDPTVLENGVYALRLTAYDRGGNEAQATISLVVEGNRKVGQFTLAFNDLEVPLAGIPIQVVRTYDSRDKRSGEFGVGWRLGLKALRVTATRAPGTGWEVAKNGLDYVLVPGRQGVVSVTLPSGRVETFAIRVTPSTSPLVPFSTVRASIVPLPGTLGTLQLLDNPDLLVVDPQPGPVTLVDDGTLEPFEPDRFLYTQRDGTQFVVTRSRGVESAKDANGNEIRITRGGITHSSGNAIVFTRDANDRITAIADPQGRTRTYAYSAAGDLAEATDRLGNTTKFFYDRGHRMLRIENPLGDPPMRADYDDAGRLVSVTDANGHTTKYSHDLPGRESTFEDALGRISVYRYDERGNATSVTDPLGNTTSYTFDARDRPLTVVDPLGNRTAFSWDDQDNPTSYTDPLGRVTSFTHDAAGRMLSLTDPLGNVFRTAYDAVGNPASSTDPLGNVTTRRHDTSGNVTELVSASGRVTRMGYDAGGRRTQVIDALGGTLAFQFDASGNVLSQQEPGAPPSTLSYDAESQVTFKGFGALQRSYAYDAAGRMTSATSARNRSATIQNDAVGQITAILESNTPVLRSGYDAAGNLISAFDRLGNEVVTTYDGADRPVSIRTPNGAVQAQAYDAAGRLIERRDARGNATRFAYDAAGQEVSMTDAAGGVWRSEYDARGLRTASVDPLGRRTEFDYDELRRLVRVRHPDGSTQLSAYNGEGELIASTDELGNVTRYAYDSRGRLVSVTDSLGNVTRHGHDLYGARRETTDANGRVTVRNFDDSGRLTRITYPSGRTESATYSATGELLSRTNGAGETVQFQYDDRGRLEAVVSPGGATERYAYTQDNLVASMTDARGTTTFAYDPTTRALLRVTEPDGRYVRYAYDLAGNRTELGQGGPGVAEEVVRYGYDALNRLISVTESSGATTTQTYDAVGNLTSIRRPGGVTTTNAYDARNRVASVAHRSGSGTLIAEESYTVDASGRRTQVRRSDGSRIDYSYDGSGRLVREQRFAAGGAPVLDSTFDYDAVGNLTTHGSAGATTRYVYDADDQIVSGGGVGYVHDAAGRRIREDFSGPGGGAQSVHYFWDARDRLVRYRDAAGHETSYLYDAERVRQGKGGAAGTVGYVVDRNHLSRYSQILRRSAGPGVDAFVWGTHLLAADERGTRRYPLQDALGTTRDFVDAAGAPTDRYDYEAFGRPSSSSGVSQLPHRFAGEELDAESGLIYLRARYYDPKTRRFLSRDPWSGVPDRPASHHPYSYAANDPVNFGDPSGNEFTLVGLTFAQAQQKLARAQEVLKTRKSLATSKRTVLGTTRVLAGILAVDTIIENATSNDRTARWFGGGLVKGALQLGTGGYYGDAVGQGIQFVASVLMGMTAIKLLDGGKVQISVQGLDVILSDQITDMGNAITGASTPHCAADPNAAAFASLSGADRLEICTRYFGRPLHPTRQTLQGAGSQVGIFLHEFTHLAIRTRDTKYHCTPTGARALAQHLIPGAGLFNADSYRCWAEDTAVGWGGSSYPK